MGAEGSIVSVLGGERAAALVAEVIDAASEGIALLGPDGRVLLANHAACRLLGREAEEVSGLTLSDLLEGVDLDREIVDIAAARVRREDGASPELDVRVIELAGHAGVRAVGLSDPTGRAEIEGRLLEISERDPLTGLLNRRRFEIDVEKELARAHRYGGGALLVLGTRRLPPLNESDRLSAAATSSSARSRRWSPSGSARPTSPPGSAATSSRSCSPRSQSSARGRSARTSSS